MFGYEDRIKIYFSDEVACAKRIGVVGEVSVVLFQPGENPIENSRRLSTKQIFQWLAAARSDVQRVFTSRVV